MEIFYSWLNLNFANWSIEELQGNNGYPILIKRKLISSRSKDLINILPIRPLGKIGSKTFIMF